MKSVMFDGITRNLSDVSTRRSFVRLIGGAAAMGAGLVLTHQAEASAKGKGHGTAKSQAHGTVRAAGKGKKLTICVNGVTRTIPNRSSQSGVEPHGGRATVRPRQRTIGDR